MAEEKDVNWQQVLTKLEGEKAKIEAAIAGIKGLMGVGTGSHGLSISPTLDATTPAHIRFDTFFGMSVADASRGCPNLQSPRPYNSCSRTSTRGWPVLGSGRPNRITMSAFLSLRSKIFCKRRSIHSSHVIDRRGFEIEAPAGTLRP